MKVELTEAEDDEVQPHRCEMHVRVLSSKALDASLKLPAEVLAQIETKYLHGYSETASAFFGDLRDEGDAEREEFPHEQWWILPYTGGR